MNSRQPPTNALLLSTAVAAAQAGSAHASHERARNQEANLIATHDVKLKLDVECQQVITRTILAAFPDHAVLGEEDVAHATPPADAYEWIIDPIDGTVNFFHGSPYWCSSVAVRRNGVVLAGCVCAPDVDLLFQASCDSRRAIAWKPSARRDSLLVREYEEPQGADVVLDWNELAALPVEARIQRLARWVDEAERDQRRYRLVLPGQPPLGPAGGATHRHACLRALALLPGAGGA